MRTQPRTEGLPREITQLPLTYNPVTKSSSLGEEEADGWQSAVHLRLGHYGLELLERLPKGRLLHRGFLLFYEHKLKQSSLQWGVGLKCV